MLSISLSHCLAVMQSRMWTTSTAALSLLWAFSPTTLWHTRSLREWTDSLLS